MNDEECHARTPKSAYYLCGFVSGLVWFIASVFFKDSAQTPAFLGNLVLTGWWGLVLAIFAGTGLVAVGFSRNRILHGSQYQFVRVSIFTALWVHAAMVCFSLPLFSVPIGSDIRPMGWSMVTFFLAAWAFFFGFLPAFISLVAGRLRILSAVLCIVGLTPIVTSTMLLHFAQKLRGFTLAP